MGQYHKLYNLDKKEFVNGHSIDNVRMFDLVRYMRAELHEADLITLEEYAWLCGGTALSSGGGSPSPRRLEDYDQLRKKSREVLENSRNAAVGILEGGNPKTIAEALLEYCEDRLECEGFCKPKVDLEENGRHDESEI